MTITFRWNRDDTKRSGLWWYSIEADVPKTTDALRTRTGTRKHIGYERVYDRRHERRRRPVHVRISLLARERWRRTASSVPLQLKEALRFLYGLGPFHGPCSWRTLWFHFTFHRRKWSSPTSPPKYRPIPRLRYLRPAAPGSVFIVDSFPSRVPAGQALRLRQSTVRSRPPSTKELIARYSRPSRAHGIVAAPAQASSPIHIWFRTIPWTLFLAHLFGLTAFHRPSPPRLRPIVVKPSVSAEVPSDPRPAPMLRTR